MFSSGDLDAVIEKLTRSTFNTNNKVELIYPGPAFWFVGRKGYPDTTEHGTPLGACGLAAAIRRSSVGFAIGFPNWSHVRYTANGDEWPTVSAHVIANSVAGWYFGPGTHVEGQTPWDSQFFVWASVDSESANHLLTYDWAPVKPYSLLEYIARAVE